MEWRKARLLTRRYFFEGFSLMLDELRIKLSHYIEGIENNGEHEASDDFPSKKQLNVPDSHLPIIIEQAKKLLQSETDSDFFESQNWLKDEESLLALFTNDLEQFSTQHNLNLTDDLVSSYGKMKISGDAFFHLAKSSLFPTYYKSIDLLEEKPSFDIYSGPFKIRVALENKLKCIVGFKCCDITRYRKTRAGVSELPFSEVIKELIKFKCLDLPCSLKDILKIYSWSCNFCHTGEKEHVWVTLKALEIIAPLFSYDDQKEYEFDITDLWGKCVLTEDSLIEKMGNYKGYLKPIYYFKRQYSIQWLEKKLNSSKNPALRYYTFH
jgi:hypothetical protein